MSRSPIHKLLKAHGVALAPGLSEDEVQRTEQLYEIRFPPDLRELLMEVLPLGDRFYNWRDFSESNIRVIRKRLDWPLEGMLFDVEHNVFWPGNWGVRPTELEQAKAIATAEYAKVPRLIPLYSHRFIPETPHEAGNPVFSVHQMDVIHYGENLEEYFKIEFRDKSYEEIDWDTIRPIPFWGKLDLL